MHYLSSNDIAYIVALAILTAWSIFANAFLLYMIICRSPKNLSPYRIFLGNAALTQLLLSIDIIVVAPRIMTEGSDLVVIYLGPVQFLGPWWSYMLYIIEIHFALNSFVSLMISMVYRYLVLRLTYISSRVAVLMCLGAYIMPLSIVVVCNEVLILVQSSKRGEGHLDAVAIHNDLYTKKCAFELFPCLGMEYSADAAKAAEITHYTVPHMENYADVVTVSVMQPCLLWLLFCCSVLNIVIYAVMYYCRWKILNLLSKSKHSTNTDLNIKQFIKALTLQSLVPALSIFPSIIGYLFIQIGVLRPHVFGFFISPCLCIGTLLDPIITMYYISPYRTFIGSILKNWSISTSSHFHHSDMSNASHAGGILNILPQRR